MKKISKISILLAVLAASISMSSFGSSKMVLADSSLNTDKSLGIFRDLSKEEIKEYYSGLKTGLNGEELLADLQPILKKNQVKLDYTSGDITSKSWSGYYLLDRDWEKSPLTESEINSQKYQTSNIWMDILYSSYSIKIDSKINSGTMQWEENGQIKSVNYKNGSAQFDREHVFPKSFGFNGANERYKNLTAGCDMQNLHAGEHIGNVSHSNLPYGDVVKSKSEVKSGITGEVVGYLGYNDDNIQVFEPIAEDKGDIARTIFYMCARYHTYEELGNNDNTPSLTLTKNPNRIATTEPEDTKNSPSAYGDLDELLKWNQDDPVSYKEIHRNNLCYNAVQYNRNPFIDYPSWAEIAFGESKDGIDLSKDDGVSSNTPNFTISSSITSIYKNETIDLSKINIDFDGNSIPVLNVIIDITTPSNVKANSVNLEDYEFKELGTYTVEFSYYDIESNKTYQSQMSIEVIPRYRLQLDTSKLNLRIEAFKSFNFDDLIVKRIYNDGTSVILDSSEYSIEVYDSENNLIENSGEYKINKLGTYTVKVTHNYDNDLIEANFEIVVGIPRIILFIVAIVILVIVVIVLVCVYNKSKKKNKKAIRTKKRNTPVKSNKRR